MQSHWNYGTDVNLTIRKPRKHANLSRKTTLTIKPHVLMHLLLNKSTDNASVLYIIGTVSMSMKACGHPKLTTERRTHRTTLTAGNITRNMLPQESTETVERSLVCFSPSERIRDCKRSRVDSRNNSASPLLYTKCFQTSTPLTT